MMVEKTKKELHKIIVLLKPNREGVNLISSHVQPLLVDFDNPFNSGEGGGGQ